MSDQTHERLLAEQKAALRVLDELPGVYSLADARRLAGLDDPSPQVDVLREAWDFAVEHAMADVNDGSVRVEWVAWERLHRALARLLSASGGKPTLEET